MKYFGKLYGKIGNKYVPLKTHSDDVDKLVEENDNMKTDIFTAVEYLRGLNEHLPGNNTLFFDAALEKLTKHIKS